MKKILLTSAMAALLIQAVNVYATEAYDHNIEVKEILNIHTQMTEIDKQLAKNPDDQSLKQTLKKLEDQLVAKMRDYNQKRKEIYTQRQRALEALPAAGPQQDN